MILEIKSEPYQDKKTFSWSPVVNFEVQPVESIVPPEVASLIMNGPRKRKQKSQSFEDMDDSETESESYSFSDSDSLPNTSPAESPSPFFDFYDCNCFYVFTYT